MNQSITIAILMLFAVVLTIVHVRSIKRAIVERDELHRWHSYWEQTRRWLAEFPDAADALEHLKANVTGDGGTDIQRTREAMRTRRDCAKVIKLSPAEIQSGHDRVRWAEGLIRQLPAEHDGRNSWLLNYAEFTPAEKLIADDFGIAYPGDR